MKYMNAKKVPMLFVATGAAKFTDPKSFPWTIGYNPSYLTEAHVYAQYIVREKPDAKIAILTQNDDFGRDYVKGLKEGLGSKANMIVAEATYEVTDPTVDSQMLKLKASGADVLFNGGTPKFAAQTIKKAAELGWTPLQILNINSISVSEVLQPAGLENSKGLITINYGKDPTDPQWKDDPGIEDIFPVHGEVLSGRGEGQRVQYLWVRHGGTDGPRTKAMRRRSYPREPDEAGDQHQEFRRHAWSPRHHDHDDARRLSRHQAIPDAALRRHPLDSVWTDRQR
jgi:hypothetical protein